VSLVENKVVYMEPATLIFRFQANYSGTKEGLAGEVGDTASLSSLFNSSSQNSGGLASVYPRALSASLNTLTLLTGVPLSAVRVLGGVTKTTMGLITTTPSTTAPPSPLQPPSKSLNPPSVIALSVGGGVVLCFCLYAFLAVQILRAKAGKTKVGLPEATKVLSSHPPTFPAPSDNNEQKPPVFESHNPLSQGLVATAGGGAANTITPAAEQKNGDDRSSKRAAGQAPLPPLLPAASQPVLDDWESVEDTDGDVYYRHRETMVTAWFRPGADVESLICSETGEKYYVNLMTGISYWEKDAGGKNTPTPTKQGTAAPAPLVLEDAWMKGVDRDGDVFWVNELTRATSWDLPPGARIKENPSSESLGPQKGEFFVLKNQQPGGKAAAATTQSQAATLVTAGNVQQDLGKEVGPNPTGKVEPTQASLPSSKVVAANSTTSAASTTKVGPLPSAKPSAPKWSGAVKKPTSLPGPSGLPPGKAAPFQLRKTTETGGVAGGDSK